jgi:hypothetical protein
MKADFELRNCREPLSLGHHHTDLSPQHSAWHLLMAEQMNEHVTGNRKGLPRLSESVFLWPQEMPLGRQRPRAA